MTDNFEFGWYDFGKLTHTHIYAKYITEELVVYYKLLTEHNWINLTWFIRLNYNLNQISACPSLLCTILYVLIFSFSLYCLRSVTLDRYFHLSTYNSHNLSYSLHLDRLTTFYFTCPPLFSVFILFSFLTIPFYTTYIPFTELIATASSLIKMC